MKTALVTGASRGLGARIALRLADDGWAVAVNYARDAAGAGEVGAAIRGKGGLAFESRFDVTDAGAVAAGIAEIRDRLGPVDLLVNNATGPQPEKPIMELSWQDYLDQLDFFVKAPLLLVQRLLPDWRERRSGRIVNVGSEVVELGNANFSSYVAAKGAMLGLTRAWATELGPEGITVNLVAPGWIPVERHAGADEASLAGYRSAVPLGRQGAPEDIAAAVAFLASRGGDFITGQKIAVNGGRTYL